MIKDLFKTPFARGNTIGFLVAIIGFIGPHNLEHLVWFGNGIIFWSWVEKYLFSKYDNRKE